MTGSGYVLVINCGSSSIKFSVVDHESGTHEIKGMAERLGHGNAKLQWETKIDDGSRNLNGADHGGAMRAIADLLAKETNLTVKLAAIGHRVVHGGEIFSSSARIDPRVLSAIESCNHLAPLHNPANLLGITTAQTHFPELPQVAVFDTTFHRTLRERAYLYAVPYDLYEKHGVRRYGFHGTSHQYVTERAAALLGKAPGDCAFVSAHLGNGCSACAVLGGKSVDTTMGLTPLEGLVMGSRSGDVDPGLHGYLQERLGWTLDSIGNMLNEQSGLQGISGLANDMRELIDAAASGHSRARLAIEIFCFRLAKAIAALFVSLGTVATVIFTGGIGENASSIRNNVIQQLHFLGFEIDAERNRWHGSRSQGRITKGKDRIAMVVPTDEEMMIARETHAVIGELHS